MKTRCRVDGKKGISICYIKTKINNHAAAAVGANVFSPSYWYKGSIGSTFILNMYFFTFLGSALSWYEACLRVGTENTWSSSSSDRAFVSGTKNRMRTNPATFHAAYHPNAPCGVNAPIKRGVVMEMTKLKNHVVAVAKDMPMSRK